MKQGNASVFRPGGGTDVGPVGAENGGGKVFAETKAGSGIIIPVAVSGEQTDFAGPDIPPTISVDTIEVVIFVKGGILRINVKVVELGFKTNIAEGGAGAEEKEELLDRRRCLDPERQSLAST